MYVAIQYLVFQNNPDVSVILIHYNPKIQPFILTYSKIDTMNYLHLKLLFNPITLTELLFAKKGSSQFITSKNNTTKKTVQFVVPIFFSLFFSMYIVCVYVCVKHQCFCFFDDNITKRISSPYP